jgi:hypothetical protein
MGIQAGLDSVINAPQGVVDSYNSNLPVGEVTPYIPPPAPESYGGYGGINSLQDPGQYGFVPQDTGGAQNMQDLLARQRQTFMPMMAGTTQSVVVPEEQTEKENSISATEPDSDIRPDTIPDYTTPEYIQDIQNQYENDYYDYVNQYPPVGNYPQDNIQPETGVQTLNVANPLQDYAPLVDTRQLSDYQPLDVAPYSPVVNYATAPVNNYTMNNTSLDNALSEYIYSSPYSPLATRGLNSLAIQNPSVRVPTVSR